MATCKECRSERTAWVTAKCSDMCTVRMKDKEKNGYVPVDMGIGGGDYLEFDYCLDCGSIVGRFPLKPTALETGSE